MLEGDLQQQANSNGGDSGDAEQAQTEKPQVTYGLEDRLRDATISKTKGNDLYKEKKYQEAIQAYTQGLSIAHPDLFRGASQLQLQKMAELNVVLLQNMAACYYSIGNFQLSSQLASQILTINPNHFKGLFRKALCEYELGHYEEALELVKKAYTIDSTAAEVNELYAKVIKAYKQEKASKKQLYRSMFSNKESQQEKSPTKSTKQDKPSGSVYNIIGGLTTALLLTGASMFFKK